MRPALSALLALLLLAAPAVSVAQSKGSFWDFADEQRGSFTEKMAQADAYALRSAEAQGLDLDERHGWAKKALAAYAEASLADPSQAEPHFRAAEIISRHYLQGRISARDRLLKAIEEWRAFEKKAPDDPRLRRVLNDRSIALTKLYGLNRNASDLEAAIGDYNEELKLVDQSSAAEALTVATLLSNRSELHMMLGRLDKAIEGYEHSLEFSDNALAGYGLAVALDRDGQRTRARDLARVHAQSDRSNQLIADGTFFVPFGEQHYYFAIRHEGLGDYRAAAEDYREFLRILPRSQWAPMARRNLAEVLPKAAKQPRPQPSPIRLQHLPWP